MKYEKPEMEIVVFSERDVITASTLIGTDIPGGGGTDDKDSVDFGSGFN